MAYHSSNVQRNQWWFGFWYMRRDETKRIIPSRLKIITKKLICGSHRNNRSIRSESNFKITK